jgi:hypothetical protein
MVFPVKTRCVLCEVRAEYLYIVYVNSIIFRVKSYTVILLSNGRLFEIYTNYKMYATNQKNSLPLVSKVDTKDIMVVRTSHRS